MFVNYKWNFINKDILIVAISNTAKNRRTTDYIDNSNKYIELIEDDSRLKELWKSYQNNYEYAKNISFNDTINAVKFICALLEENIIKA